MYKFLNYFADNSFVPVIGNFAKMLFMNEFLAVVSPGRSKNGTHNFSYLLNHYYLNLTIVMYLGPDRPEVTYCVLLVVQCRYAV